MIDLHVHSNCSDGSLSPSELVDYAIRKGLTAFALTDHDTVDGLVEAMTHAEELRKSGSVVPEVIPGIEFSTEYQGADVHILGLYVDYNNPKFADHLKAFVNSRDLRNQKICDLLQKAGMNITYEDLLNEYPDAVITRAHFATLLLKKGYTKSLKEAFERYIGDHCPCFVPREKVTPAQAVELILEAGGIPILAHPTLYHMSDARLETLVAQLKAVGLIGLEAIYSTHSPSEERQLRALAKKYHLLISGGTDFHGATKPDLDLGTGYGRMFIHEEVLEKLCTARKKILFTDMDGTLLLNNSTISPAMRNGILNMTKAGHHLILSSGRPLPSILDVCKQADLDFPNMRIVSNNGALVYDCDSGKPILSQKICQADVAKIVHAAREAGIYAQGYTETHIICTAECPELTFYTGKVQMPVIFADDIAKALPQGSYKIQIIHLSDRSKLEKLRETLLADEDLGPRIQAVFSNDKYLEILPAEASKGNALTFVADHIPVLRTHTYAAGDAENDISMLEAARVGIAMENATPAVKACADIITERSNNEDGLLDIILREFC